MSERLRKLWGVLLVVVAIGVVSWQALLVSCSSPGEIDGAGPVSAPSEGVRP